MPTSSWVSPTRINSPLIVGAVPTPQTITLQDSISNGPSSVTLTSGSGRGVPGSYEIAEGVFVNPKPYAPQSTPGSQQVRTLDQSAPVGQMPTPVSIYPNGGLPITGGYDPNLNRFTPNNPNSVWERMPNGVGDTYNQTLQDAMSGKMWDPFLAGEQEKLAKYEQNQRAKVAGDINRFGFTGQGIGAQIASGTESNLAQNRFLTQTETQKAVNDLRMQALPEARAMAGLEESSRQFGETMNYNAAVFGDDKARYGQTEAWKAFENAAKYGSDQDVIDTYQRATGKTLDASSVASIRGVVQNAAKNLATQEAQGGFASYIQSNPRLRRQEGESDEAYGARLMADPGAAYWINQMGTGYGSMNPASAAQMADSVNDPRVNNEFVMLSDDLQEAVRAGVITTDTADLIMTISTNPDYVTWHRDANGNMVIDDVKIPGMGTTIYNNTGGPGGATPSGYTPPTQPTNPGNLTNIDAGGKPLGLTATNVGDIQMTERGMYQKTADGKWLDVSADFKDKKPGDVVQSNGLYYTIQNDGSAKQTPYFQLPEFQGMQAGGIVVRDGNVYTKDYGGNITPLTIDRENPQSDVNDKIIAAGSTNNSQYNEALKIKVADIFENKDWTKLSKLSYDDPIYLKAKEMADTKTFDIMDVENGNKNFVDSFKLGEVFTAPNGRVYQVVKAPQFMNTFGREDYYYMTIKDVATGNVYDLSSAGVPNAFTQPIK